MALSREEVAALDAADELAPLRAAFQLPDGMRYFGGHSLGPLPRAARERAKGALSAWGGEAVGAWNSAGWIDQPQRVGDTIGRLIGAEAGEVLVADSTSVNLFRLLLGACQLRTGRPVILTDTSNFPTDGYIAESVAAVTGGRVVRVKPADVGAALSGPLGQEVAVLTLTQMDFRTAAIHDVAALTAAAHAAGALTLWDLSHSAGVLPLAVGSWGVDLAVGATYKHLNGGPGSPAFLYVASRLQESLPVSVQGWMGHATPFDFSAEYKPAAGIRRQEVGTPPILSLAALEGALTVFDGVPIAALRAKSTALGDLFIRLVDEQLAGALACASPREGAKRGSQVAFRFDEGYALMQACIARGVIGDFRAPACCALGWARCTRAIWTCGRRWRSWGSA